MATLVVAFDGSRVNPADVVTNWGHWTGGGAAPGPNPQNAYQNALAVDKKCTGTGGAFTGIDYDPGSGALDMTGAVYPLWFCKMYVADYGDLNTTFGVKAALGSALADHYAYNLAGSGAANAVFTTYPARGGYLIVPIDPNIAAWRDATSAGSPDLTIVDWFGGQSSFVAGGAKAENFAIDAIDLGTGLTISRGDAGSTEATFQDLVDWDEGTTTNRYGCAVQSGTLIILRGMINIGISGGANPTEFVDPAAVVTFPDGYHSDGLFGITVYIENASDIWDSGATIIGEGADDGTVDTRPDHVVVGTAGSYDFNGVLQNHRNITFTSVCDVIGATLECALLTQASANISASTIITLSATSVATLQDPIFGATTDLRDCLFIQGGAGHAIEIDTAGSYTFTDLFFQGYGADTTDSAAIDVTAGTGTVTIAISGGDTPTYKTAGATVVFTTDPVTTEITVKDADSKAVIENARVYLVASDGTGAFPYKDAITSITRTGAVAEVTTPAVHGLATGDIALIEGATEEEYNGAFVITVSSTTVFTYTVPGTPTSPAGGTKTVTGGIFNELTSVAGIVTDSRSMTVDQPFTGYVRMASATPYYASQDLDGIIDKDTGFATTVFLALDE